MPLIERLAGNCRIVGEIGAGGMGKVYAGIDSTLQRPVAIKMLRPELASDSAVLERFRSEAITLARLSHPNVATIHSFSDSAEMPFLVMEYVRGWTLTEVIAASGALRLPAALDLTRQALAGVGHAHDNGVVHRDIKPGNFILTERGQLKTLDFGIARMLGAARMTRTGKLIGTLEYMSPEQIQGQETDARSDIYSIGILLYEMLTGRTPFEGASDYNLMKAQVEREPPPPRELSPGLPAALESCLLKALAKQPDNRFQSAAEFAATLSSITTADTGLEPLLAELARRSPLLPPPTFNAATAPQTRIADATALAADALPTAGSGRQPRASKGRLMWPHYAALCSVAVALLALGLWWSLPSQQPAYSLARNTTAPQIIESLAAGSLASPGATQSNKEPLVVRPESTPHGSIQRRSAGLNRATTPDASAPAADIGEQPASVGKPGTVSGESASDPFDPAIASESAAPATATEATATAAPEDTPAIEQIEVGGFELPPPPADGRIPGANQPIRQTPALPPIALAPPDLRPGPPTDAVARLLTNARDAFERKQLLTPEHDSAIGWAQQALALDAGNPEAQALIGSVIDRYLGWAQSQLARGAVRKARGNIGKAKTLEGYATDAQAAKLATLGQRAANARVVHASSAKRVSGNGKKTWFRRFDEKMQRFGCAIDRKLGKGECAQR